MKFTCFEKAIDYLVEREESPEFKRFFGDWEDPLAWSSANPTGTIKASLAVEPSSVSGRGKPFPKVLYHATHADFTKFDPRHGGRNLIVRKGKRRIESVVRNAVFLAEDPEDAEDFLYQEGRIVGARIIPVYINVRNPLFLTSDAIKDGKRSDVLDNEEWEQAGIDVEWLDSVTETWELFDGSKGADFVNGLKKLGVDAVVFDETSHRSGKEMRVWAVFDPRRIKSVFARRFDPESEDFTETKKDDNLVIPSYLVKKAKKLGFYNINFDRLGELGFTNNWREAGFITPDGKLVDFSGKKEGGSSNIRNYDHREVGGTLGMQELMMVGFIRFLPECPGFDMATEPTPSQYDVIRSIVHKANGEVCIECSKNMELSGQGYYYRVSDENTMFKEYRKGTHPDAVINDIKKFYRGVRENNKFQIMMDMVLVEASKKLTDSPEFKRWFGKSKVVDEEGNPLVVYHATDTEFDEFRPYQHFGTHKAANDRYESLYSFRKNFLGAEHPGNFHVKPVYLKIENPLRMPDLGYIDDFEGHPIDIAKQKWVSKGIRGKFVPQPRRWENEGSVALTLFEMGIMDAEDFEKNRSNVEAYKFIERLGYDGIVYENKIEDPGSDSWIIFRPDQARSIFSFKNKLSVTETINQILSERTLYHGTIVDNEESIRKHGLVGGWKEDSWVSDAYPDEYYGQRSEYDDVVFMTDKQQLRKAVNAMVYHIGKKLGKNFREVSDNDIRNHGLLVVIKDSDLEPVDVDYGERPRGAERGDYVSPEETASYFLKGAALIRFLRRHGAWPRGWGRPGYKTASLMKGEKLAKRFRAKRKAAGFRGPSDADGGY